jgi:DnaK suppressor protein
MKKAIKEKLRKEYELRAKSILISMQNNRDEVDIYGDVVDQIQGSSIAKMQQALSLRDKATLKNIEDALTKMDEGTFGQCESCGEYISEKRLHALPGVKICIVCAEESEM